MIFSRQHIPIWVACTNPNADMLIKKVWWQHVDIVEEHLQQIRIKNNIISFIQHIEKEKSLLECLYASIGPHLCSYLIEERVISSFDASSVSFSTNVYFHNRLYVVSRQLATLDDPDPDLDNGRKIRSLTNLMSCSSWFQPWKKLNWSNANVKWD